MSIVDLNIPKNHTRWAPYTDWVNYISEKDFINHNFTYDFQNPVPNPDTYRATRESLIQKVKDFVAETDGDFTVEQLKKTTYTEQEAYEWQHELMHWTLDTWLYANRSLLKDINKYKKEAEKAKREAKKLKKELAELKNFVLTPKSIKRWRRS